MATSVGHLRSLGPGDPATVGPYVLRALIGEGGMGRVFLARSPAGRSVAVKVVHPELADDPLFRRRFSREVTVARRVASAYTAPVLDADPDGPLPWLATLYVPGPSLREAVEQAGPLSPDACLTLGAGMLEAMGAVHLAGIAHRDLKPSNVLLAVDGPRLIDFGIARSAGQTALTRSGQVFGTAAYMSPEQAAGEEVGPASDVFSFAAVLIFAATGRDPFGPGDPAAVLFRVVHDEPDLDGVPGRLLDLIRPCLVKDPAGRPAVGRLLAGFAAHRGQAPLAWPPAVVRLVREREAEVASWPLPPVSAGPSASGPPAAGPGQGVLVATRVEPERPALPAPVLPAPAFPGPVVGSAVAVPSFPRAPVPGPRPPGLARTRIGPPDDDESFVFVGRRWSHLVTGIPVLLLALVALLAALACLAGSVNPAQTPSARTGSLCVGVALAFVVAACLRRGLWRLRLGIAPPRLAVTPGGLRADAGGRSYDIPWAQLRGAQIVRLGQRDVVAAWPTPQWTVRTPHVDRQTWWLPNDRYRCIWRNPAIRCDVLFDTRMLYPTSPHQVATAIGLQAHRHAGRRR
ncbi:serine/threonine-protein kinase [Pseudofrankia inefficax]|uniref:serine/threonine-protein kinase n=1 Tax=Pseudofrankia inefficax (strain DSM 45817 / CECT 9037 / DDB 130130 / EuI1c) TaxID=298654 RepID=UPI001E538C81|nr:serine/threonine-protein kinase [Pseudofrankia inefficax]